MIRKPIKYKLDEAGEIFLEILSEQLKPTQDCNEFWELTSNAKSGYYRLVK